MWTAAGFTVAVDVAARTAKVPAMKRIWILIAKARAGGEALSRRPRSSRQTQRSSVQGRG